MQLSLKSLIQKNQVYINFIHMHNLKGHHFQLFRKLDYSDRLDDKLIKGN